MSNEVSSLLCPGFLMLLRGEKFLAQVSGLDVFQQKSVLMNDKDGLRLSTLQSVPTRIAPWLR